MSSATAGPLTVLEFVGLAASRAAALAHKDMKRGLSSLASISSTAVMVGLVGTTAQMITHTFYSCGGNWSSCDAPIGERLSGALGLGAFGLVVSVFALCSYRYLSRRIEAFDLEMKVAQLDLLNHLSLRFPNRY